MGNNNDIFIHPTAEVHTLNIGSFTKIWQFVVVQENVSIGANCNINFSCFLENGVILGNNVTVKSGIYLWDGIECADNVFLGPNTVFTNDLLPRSKQYKQPVKTYVKKGASIGANSTILAGVTIGEYAMVGIGSVVTRSIPDYALYYGNPAKFKGWIDENGNKLEKFTDNEYISTSSGKRYRLNEHIITPII